MTITPRELTPRQWALLDAALQLLKHRALIGAAIPRLSIGDVAVEEIGALWDALNTRTAIAVYQSQSVMTLSLAIDEAGLSVKQFATDVLGSRNHRRIYRMLDGAEEVPSAWLAKCQAILDHGYTAPRDRLTVAP